MSLASRLTAAFTAIGNHIRDSVVPRLVPAGGQLGQVLAKSSNDNYAAGWSGIKSGSFPITIRESGRYIWTALNGTAMTTLAGVANRVEVHPFRPDENITIDQLELTVTTAVAGSLFKLGIWASDPTTGLPTGAALRGTGDMSGAAVATPQSAIAPLTLQKGVLYWFGCHFSSTTTVRANAVASMLSLCMFSASSTPLTVLRATQVYASGLPNGNAFTTANLASVPAASVRMRLA